MISNILIALVAITGVEAANSTILIGSSPPFSSTPDVVTRSPLPTSSCAEPLLTVIRDTPASLTSTLTTTSVYTITSCPPTVTNCPVGSETTETMVYTTVCPGTSTPGGSSAGVTSGVTASNGSVPASPSSSSIVVTAGASDNAVNNLGGVFALVAAAAAGYLL